MTDQGDDEHNGKSSEGLKPKERFRLIENNEEIKPSSHLPNRLARNQFVISQLHLIETDKGSDVSQDESLEEGSADFDNAMVALPLDRKMVALRAALAILRQEHQDLADFYRSAWSIGYARSDIDSASQA